ncbi:MAG TPA: MoaD/ThiS family protein [Acidobacteriaceae bacterium]|jgi:molybdopterin converting factor small subunit|nr:MoaD/ThiS family protein [Acidobacteriaceae bacterium]
MAVRVLLPNAFQKHTNGAREIQSSAGNLPALLTEIETTFPALKTHLRDDSGQVRKFINFYVNEEDIRFLGNEKYAFQDGDEVLVIPSIAGGCCAGLAVPAEARFARGENPDRPMCSCCSYCGQEECCCGD